MKVTRFALVKGDKFYYLKETRHPLGKKTWEIQRGGVMCSVSYVVHANILRRLSSTDDPERRKELWEAALKDGRPSGGYAAHTSEINDHNEFRGCYLYYFDSEHEITTPDDLKRFNNMGPVDKVIEFQP